MPQQVQVLTHLEYQQLESLFLLLKKFHFQSLMDGCPIVDAIIQNGILSILIAHNLYYIPIYNTYQPQLNYCNLYQIHHKYQPINYSNQIVIPLYRYQSQHQTTLTQTINIINMNQLQIQANSEKNSLIINIQYPTTVNFTYKFEMQICVHLQQIPSMKLTQVYRTKINIPKKNVRIDGLQYGKSYKVAVRANGGNNISLQKNVYIFTSNKEQEEQNYQASNQIFSKKSQLISSKPRKYSQVIESDLLTEIKQKQQMSKSYKKTNDLCNSQLLLKLVGEANNVSSKNNLHTYIMEGRKCRNMSEFINQKTEKLHNRKKVLQKKILLAQGIVFFDDIYSQKPGMKYFQNDWFMGPFYSYDTNEEGIHKR